ncbi:MAG: hypothetical protein IT338_00970 [Thermomicrobiales bacterium]|nr:hypothetical protein [Thermomicrobiales bacterium]
MFGRENAIGVALLVLCAIVALVLLSNIASGTRPRLNGPSWLGPALAALFIGGTIWAFVSRPGHRWPWDKNRD